MVSSTSTTLSGNCAPVAREAGVKENDFEICRCGAVRAVPRSTGVELRFLVPFCRKCVFTGEVCL